MFSNRLIQAALTVSIVLLQSACSSDGGDGTTGTTASIATGVTSSGTINAFGSVIVNGVRFETENSRIISTDDGSVIAENPTDDQLKTILGVGQTVTVRGTRTDATNGVASSISFDNELVGEITSVAANDGSFVVLGQTVSVTPDTIIDDSIVEAARGTEILNDPRFGDLPESLDQLLNAGMIVEVNGFPSQNGLEATRIEDLTGQVVAGGGGFEAEVKGFIANLVSGQFEINGLTIFYDEGDLDSEDFNGQPLADGQFVEVHGNVLSANAVDANRIELEDDFVNDDFTRGEIEIEGVIQAVRPDAQGTGGVIVINGLEIRVDDVSPFSEGLRVEIEGILQTDGSIVVTRLQDEAEDTVRTEDAIVSADGTRLTTRLGLTLAPTERTRLEDDTVEHDDNLSIADFLANAAGKRIETRGFPLNGATVWTRMEIKDEDDQDCRLRGPVADITGTEATFSFTIEGVNIDVSQVGENNFEGSSDQPIGRTAFFDALTAGTVVQATSDDAGSGCVVGTLTAREVQLEPDDDVLVGDDGSVIDNGNGVNDNEISGTVSNITATTFIIAGETVAVDADTVIDSSIIEAARGVEIANDLPLGSLTETLPELLPNGLNVVVGVDRSGGVLAIYIENI